LFGYLLQPLFKKWFNGETMEEVVRVELDHIKESQEKTNETVEKIFDKMIELDKKIEKMFTYKNVLMIGLSVFVMPIVVVVLTHYLK